MIVKASYGDEYPSSIRGTDWICLQMTNGDGIWNNCNFILQAFWKKWNKVLKKNMNTIRTTESSFTFRPIPSIFINYFRMIMFRDDEWNACPFKNNRKPQHISPRKHRNKYIETLRYQKICKLFTSFSRLISSKRHNKYSPI